MSILISIDGNIGSGKSTLLEMLKYNLNSLCLGEFANDYEFVFLQEPVNEWEHIKNKDGESIISLFYKDQKQYSFSFQMMAYISRLNEIKKYINSNKKVIIISERSVHTDKHVFAKMLYDENLMEDVNYTIYNKWFDCFISEVPLKGIVYLDVHPSLCKKRVQKRNRNGEDISLLYLENCKKYHDTYVSQYDHITLNGDDVLKNNENKFICEIGSYIYQLIK